MFANNQNLEDLIQGNGRVIQHGRNSAFPVVMSSDKVNGNLVAMMAYGGGGFDFIFNKQIDDPTHGPRITSINSLGLVEHIVFFGQNPIDTSKEMNKAIKLGNLW